MANRRIEEVEFVAPYLALNPDESQLITVGQSPTNYSRPYIQTYSTADFAPAVSWKDYDYLGPYYETLTVHPIRNEFYFGEKVFNLDTGFMIETLVAKVLAVSQSGKYLYGTGPRSAPRMSILSWNGITWTEHFRIHAEYAEAIALTPDEAKVYMANRDVGVRVIDLRPFNLH